MFVAISGFFRLVILALQNPLEFKVFPCKRAELERSLATRKQRLAFTPVYHMEPPHLISDRRLF